MTRIKHLLFRSALSVLIRGLFFLLFYGDAVTQLFEVARGDEFIGGDSASYLDQVAVCLPHLHKSLFRVTVFDYIHTTDAGFVDNGSSRNQHCRLSTLLQKSHRRKLARLQSVTAVLNLSFDIQRTRLRRNI